MNTQVANIQRDKNLPGNRKQEEIQNQSKQGFQRRTGETNMKS